MTKFRLLGAALAVAVAAFTVSCDKDSLPEAKVPGVNIGDGETSALIVNAIFDENISDLNISYGESILASNLDYKESTDAFGIKTGKSLMTITAFDSESGQDIEIYNEYITVEDESLYRFVVTQNEDGTDYQVDILDYSSEDLQFSDEDMYELGLAGNSDNFTAVNGYNYNYGFKDGDLVADFGYTSNGQFYSKEIAFGDYASETTFGLNNDGYYSNLNLTSNLDEDASWIDGENGQILDFSSVLSNLNFASNSSSNSEEILNMFVVGEENNTEVFFIDMGSLKINYNSLNVE
jgi:hypothetical protein